MVSGPMAATRPIALAPGTKGVGYVRNSTLPAKTSVVEGSMILVRMRTTTLPGTALGTGMDWTVRGCPTPGQMRARQVEGRDGDSVLDMLRLK